MQWRYVCKLVKHVFVQNEICHMTFRNVPKNRKSWAYLILKATHSITGKTHYFVDKCLPFGASVSCAIFQELLNSIAHLVRYRTHKPLVNYLDDFLDVCDRICFPVSLEKTFWGTQLLTHYEVLPFCSSKYSDKNSNTLSRITNSFMEALNKKFLLP